MLRKRTIRNFYKGTQILIVIPDSGREKLQGKVTSLRERHLCMGG